MPYGRSDINTGGPNFIFIELEGALLAIDTACSSSLVAIAEACNSLVLRNCDLALAGGVCVLPEPSVHIMTSKAGMLSPTMMLTFDARANGLSPAREWGFFC
jgi:acyl transferase domain-containing protein